MTEQDFATGVYDVTNPDSPAGRRALAEAAALIRQGGLVAFPTETVYGLGADALNEEAVRLIFTAKGRPSDNPLIVHVSEIGQAKTLTTGWDGVAEQLAETFWPGPLTLILPRVAAIPDVTTGGLTTVGIRWPDHPVAQALIRAAGTPIAAPSANLSGGPSPTRAEHVVNDLTGRVPLILTAGDCRVGIESTVLDLTVRPAMILRPGYVTAEDIKNRTGIEVVLDRGLNTGPTAADLTPRAPGMKYRHYAPKAEVIVLCGAAEKIRAEMTRQQGLATEQGRLAVAWFLGETPPDQVAYELFARLREADAAGADLFLAGAISERSGLGFAIMNRLLKSAGYRIIDL